MAEMPRELFAATSREGDPLSPGAKVVLAYLWTFADAAAAAAYRNRKGPAKAPRVVGDPEEIGKVFQIDVDSVRRHLRDDGRHPRRRQLRQLHRLHLQHARRQHRPEL